MQGCALPARRKNAGYRTPGRTAAFESRGCCTGNRTRFLYLDRFFLEGANEPDGCSKHERQKGREVSQRVEHVGHSSLRHRARAAFFASSRRCSAVSCAIRALPPFGPPPSRPSATAAGFLRFAMTTNLIISAPAFGALDLLAPLLAYSLDHVTRAEG